MSKTTRKDTPRPRVRALIIDDSSMAEELRGQLLTGNIGGSVARSVDEGWTLLQQQRPSVVVLSMGLSAGGAKAFLDKLDALEKLDNSAGNARPHVVGVGIVHDRQRARCLDALVPDANQPGMLLDAVRAVSLRVDVNVSSTAIAHLLAATTLGGDPDSARRDVVKQLCRALDASACFMFLQRRDRWWSYGGASLNASQRSEVARRALQAARLDTALIMPGLVNRAAATEDHTCESYYAVHATVEHREIGVLLCFVEEYRHGKPGPSVRSLLDALAMRFRIELSWLNVHQRLAAELDTTRDSGGLDPLLSIWNRASLTRLLAMTESSSRRSGSPVTVAVLDVKQMGEINDRHGHEEGDAVLKHLAEIAIYVVRSYDVVARYGGDEIAIVFSGAAIKDSVKVLLRMMQTIDERPFETGRGIRLKLKVSAGVSALAGAEDTLEEALSRAAAGRQTALSKSRSIEVVTNQGAESPTSMRQGQLSMEGVTLHGVYRILHQIGAGGGGGVYRAEDLSLRRPVAVKVLNPDLARKESLVERFREEASILASLRHNHLVQVYAFGVENAYVYFAMELVEGESLRHAVDRCKKERLWFSFDRVTSVVQQISSALATLHRSGIIHRDVKPANVLMDPFRGRAVLVDVGIALQSQDEGWLAGTPGYMAPESARKLTRDTSADVYGLAVTIYELLTLHLPWPESTDPLLMLRSQIEKLPKPPSEWRAELAPLDAVLLRAMDANPRARWTDVDKFGTVLCERLDEVSRNLGNEGPPLSNQIDPPNSNPGKRRTSTPLLPQITRNSTAVSMAAPPAPGSRGRQPSSGNIRTGPISERSSPSSRNFSPAPSQEHGTLGGAPTMSWDAMMAEEQPTTRGVVFRTLPRVIGARSTTKWRLELGPSKKHLLDALSPSSPPLGWLPTAWLAALLDAKSLDDRGPDELGRALGRSVVRATFRRFFPASSATLSPGSTLMALPQIWNQYHSWGLPQPMAVRAESATIRITNTVASEPLSALAQGMLEGLIVLSGGTSPIIEETKCEARGDDACLFECKWTWSPKSSRPWRRS